MKRLAHLLLLFAALILAGCGGDLEAGVGSGGSGAPVDPLAVGVGTVRGFGSIIVNGERYEETSALVFIDERPDRPEPVTVAAIRLGTRVELEHRNFVIARATVAPELVGPVSSVTASGFVALGQTVRVNADAVHSTVFDGFGSLADLAQGAVVEVHGDRAPAGEILATRVQLRPAGTAIRLAGTVTAATGRTFGIGALPVDAWSATIVPAGASINAGQRVVVWTDADYSRGVLPVQLVRIDTPTIAPNAAVTLEGVVVERAGAASFRIGSVPVDAGKATFSGGSAADLVNGRSVRVKGTFVDDVLNAVSVELLAAATIVQVAGNITDFVDADRAFRIRDTLVRVTPQTAYAGGTAASLGSGVRVKAAGTLVDGVIQATSFEFEAPQIAPQTQSIVVGRVAAPVGTGAGDGSRTFRLEGPGIEVRTTPQTAYRDGAAADIAIGRQVRVAGRVQDGVFVVDELRFLDNPAAPASIEIEGVAGNVGPDAFIVNGQSVQRTATTRYTVNGVPATTESLRNGLPVQVVATRTGETLTAVSIDIRTSQAETATLRGIVSGRTPPDATRFLVGSQRVVVAGNPQIVPGNKTLADVVNGADVEVEGTLVDGVLNLTRIRFR